MRIRPKPHPEAFRNVIRRSGCWTPSQREAFHVRSCKDETVPLTGNKQGLARLGNQQSASHRSNERFIFFIPNFIEVKAAVCSHRCHLVPPALTAGKSGGLSTSVKCKSGSILANIGTHVTHVWFLAWCWCVRGARSLLPVNE